MSVQKRRFLINSKNQNRGCRKDVAWLDSNASHFWESTTWFSFDATEPTTRDKEKEKALVDSAHTLLVYELEPCAPWHGFLRLLGQIGSSGLCLDRAGDLAGI